MSPLDRLDTPLAVLVIRVDPGPERPGIQEDHERLRRVLSSSEN
jgi:hypothetical protein